MALMIPSDVPQEEFNRSYGEGTVYKALQSLPPEYTVFHSVSWHKRNERGNIVWGESDFTIFHPKRGLLVIEVKSGGIKHQNGKWTQINTLTNEEYPMKNPLIQASRSKFTFIDLLSSKTSDFNPYWVEAAVWFPSIKNCSTLDQLPPAYSPEIVLTQRDLSSVQNAIERVFDYYGMREKNTYSQNDILKVINILSPQFDAFPSLSQSIKEQTFVFNRMTQEQGALLDYLEDQRTAAIQGGAGTGKTILAIEKAKRLATYDKVLFLCFNRFLLDYLRASYSEIIPNVDFFNLPSLMHTKSRQHFSSDNDGIASFLDAYDAFDWDYQHIIIDEGQDFYSDHILLLSTIAEMQGGSFYVFYDKNQLVQQRQALEWLVMMECRLVLTVNCRNTKSIATTSYKPIGIENIKMKVVVSGSKPELYLAKDENDAFERIAKLIRKYTESGLTKKDIVILTAKTEEQSILAQANLVGSYRITRDFNQAGILFTSSRKFKGLEAPVVIMVDMDDTVFENEESRRVLYVGTSRARHFLEFVSVMDTQRLTRIAEQLIGQPIKNPRLAIASSLKVKIIIE